MPDAKLPERLPSGKSIRSKLIAPMARQVGKYVEAEHKVEELKKKLDEKEKKERG